MAVSLTGICSWLVLMVCLPCANQGVNAEFVCRKGKSDLVFILDASGSIKTSGDINWELIKNFVVNITLSLGDIGTDQNRVGLITYNHTAWNIFFLSDHDNAQDVVDEVKNLGDPGYKGKTNTSGALKVLREEQLTVEHGDRPDTPNIVIVLTDGLSEEPEETILQAGLAHDRGVILYVIGVAIQNQKPAEIQQSEREVRQMSSPPHTEGRNYWYRDEFNELDRLVDSIRSVVICNESKCDTQSCNECIRQPDPQLAVCECDGGYTSKYCYLPMTECANCSIEVQREDFTISRVCPVVMPASGADIHIWGNFPDDVQVRVGEKACQRLFYNRTYIQCVAGARNVTDYIAVPVRILDANQEVKVATDSCLTYRPDPVITDAYPLETFLSGGVEISVVGRHFNSVQNAVMEIHMLPFRIIEETNLFVSGCDKRSDNLFVCLTPEITLPERYRKRRDVSDAHDRLRRQEEEEEDLRAIVNEEGVIEFYIGFRMDNVEATRNISKLLPLKKKFMVFQDPKIGLFDPNPQLFYPHDQTNTDMPGTGLTNGCQADDYDVWIGSERCTKVELFDNLLTCKPPHDEPTTEMVNKGFRVRVTVGNLKSSPGILQYVDRVTEKACLADWRNCLEFKLGLGLGILLLLIIIIAAIIICCLRRYVRKQMEQRHLVKISPKQPESGGPVSNFMGVSILTLLHDDMKSQVRDVMADPERMEIQKVIGRGQFGLVSFGFLTTDTGRKRVAIKSIKNDNPDVSTVRSFLEEGTVMKRFQHPAVLELTAIVFKENLPYVLTPYMENGDLKSYLIKYGSNQEVRDQLIMCADVAAGMEYLGQMRFVHRDLAARNCMVGENLKVKIADFGLSRDIYGQEYYKAGSMQAPMPIKWMATESLDTGMYSTKSDRWAYGVLLWEVMSNGSTPYPNIDPLYLRRALKTGYRMEQPSRAPKRVYQIMRQCWSDAPDSRPPFETMCMRLQGIVRDIDAAGGKSGPTKPAPDYVYCHRVEPDDGSESELSPFPPPPIELSDIKPRPKPSPDEQYLEPTQQRDEYLQPI